MNTTRRVVAVSAYEQVCVLNVANEVLCWGTNDQGQLDAPGELRRPRASPLRQVMGFLKPNASALGAQQPRQGAQQGRLP